MENALHWINGFISASPEVTKIKWHFILTQLESTTFYWDIVEKVSALKDHLNFNIKHFFPVAVNSSGSTNQSNTYQATSDNSDTRLPCLLLLALSSVCDFSPPASPPSASLQYQMQHIPQISQSWSLILIVFIWLTHLIKVF